MMSFIEQLANSWWEWMSPMSMQLIVLVAVIALADAMLSRWLEPAIRVLLWGLVFLRLLLPPTLASPVSLASVSGTSATGLMATSPLATGTVLIQCLFVLWALGFFVCSGYALYRYRTLRNRLLARPSLPVPQAVSAACQRLARRLGMRKLPELMVQQDVCGPLVIGFLRPVLLLPAQVIEAASPEQLDHVILHELAHVKRRDPLTSLICLVTQLIYWFHPAAWLAQKRLSLLRELACDRIVANVLGDAAPGYRRTLLFFARPLFQKPAGVGLAFIHPASMLLRRLDSLERPRTPKLQALVATFVLPVLLLCCVPMQDGVSERLLTTESHMLRPPGCLQLRYVVFGMLAQQERDASQD